MDPSNPVNERSPVFETHGQHVSRFSDPLGFAREFSKFVQQSSGIPTVLKAEVADLARRAAHLEGGGGATSVTTPIPNSPTGNRINITA